MPPQVNAVISNAIKVAVGVLVFGAAILILASIGGTLERAGAGWLNLTEYMSYWPAHILGAQVFAIPTGLTVLIFGLHLRGSLVVAILTWFSFYLAVSSYAHVGSEIHPPSESGVFDWMLGYDSLPSNRSFIRRFSRDFAGMSLLGLTWTVPQGYALHHLGFGWQYSLSGSLMGLLYFFGTKTPLPNTTTTTMFAKQQAFSQYYWGSWLWLVLAVACLAQVIHRIHVWIYSKSPFLGFRPFSRWEQVKYDSLNYTVTLVLYEGLVAVLNLVLAASLIFYSLVNQDNERNKGKTFFSLFATTFFLAFAQGWIWKQSCSYMKLPRSRWWYRPPLDYFSAFGEEAATRLPVFSARDTVATSDERAPLLDWPYVHPERSSRDRLILPEGNSTNVSPDDRAVQSSSRQVSRFGAAFLMFWPELERWLWMDFFAWARHVLGVISLFFTVVTLVFAVISVVLNRQDPRYGGSFSNVTS